MKARLRLRRFHLVRDSNSGPGKDVAIIIIITCTIIIIVSTVTFLDR